MPEANLSPSNRPEHWPAPTPRDEILARVVKRGRRIRMINRIVVGLAITGGLGVAAAGIAVGFNGNGPFSNSAPPSVPTSGGAPYYLCPGEGDVGQLGDGARVYLTGVDDTGGWVQVRAPGNLADRAWVERHHVDPDREIELPQASCSTEEGEFERAEAAPTTTAPEPVDEPELPQDDEGEEPPVTTPSTTTSTTRPPTTAPPTTAPTTTSPPATTSTTSTTTTTTAPPATTTTTQPAPVIGNISRTPAVIREFDIPGKCSNNPNDPITSSISVNVTNATSATMTWSVGGTSGSVAMGRQGQTFSAVLGPFGEPTIPAAPGTAPIQVTVTASGPGGQRTAHTTVTLNHCEPFG